jgi:surface antigen
MKFRKFAARLAPVVALCLTIAAPAQAQFWQCATYAREVSGIDIRGNANTWWSQAEGRYERGHTPQAGAVLAFAATSRMHYGHVAMVSRVISDREVLLTHANWSHRGQIERDVRAIDVSPNGDWTQVKVWYGPTGDLGTSTYSAKGFIYSNAPHGGDVDQDVPLGSLQMASNDTSALKQFLALN